MKKSKPLKQKNKNIKKYLKQSPVWKEAERAALALSKKGHKAVIAGGAVRDALLKKTPKDIDLASSAKPEEALKIFPSAKAPFARYGVALIPLKSKKVLEAAVFRKDGGYKDGRRPDSISYGSMEEDALRRDFTVNALFYDIQSEELIDFTSGLKDLKGKRLRAVGAPKKRFKEDHLRALRALRLAHQLNFKIERQTDKAAAAFAARLKTISKERVLGELTKMFSAGRIGDALKSLKKRGFLKRLLPDLKTGSLTHSNLKFLNSPFSFLDDPGFLWAALCLPFFHSNTDAAKAFLKNRLLPSAAIKKSLGFLKAVKTLESESPLAEKLLALDGRAKPALELAAMQRKSRGLKSLKLKKLEKEFNKRARRGRLPPPLVRGSDLLKLSPPPPKIKFSALLKKAFARQIEKPKASKKEILRFIQDGSKSSPKPSKRGRA